MFGEENSTMMFLPVEGSWPKFSLPAISENNSFQKRFEKHIFKKPFTQLNELISGTFVFNQSPMAFPVASGAACDKRRRGNTTRV